MSNDTQTNDFIRDCVLMAARFCNMGRDNAGATLINIARLAVESGQETAPVKHYAPNIRAAINEAFGHPWELANLSHDKQEEAVAAWLWFEDATGAALDHMTTATTLSDAVAEMRLGGDGWRNRMRDALDRGYMYV